MNANMSFHFLSQGYERNYVIFTNVENEIRHASPIAIHATPLSHELDYHLEVRCSIPHFTAVIIAIH